MDVDVPSSRGVRMRTKEKITDYFHSLEGVQILGEKARNWVSRRDFVMNLLSQGVPTALTTLIEAAV